MSFLPAEITEGAIASMLPSEAHDIIRTVLRNGLMQYLFSRISHSLTEGRSLPGKILWTPVEWGRQYVEGKLAEQCNTLTQHLTDALAMGFTPEMLEQFRLALLEENSDLEQVIRDQVHLFLGTHVRSLQKGVTGIFANVTGMMPSFVNDLFRAFNLGELGTPAKHLWYVFERQENAKYSLTVFGTTFKIRNIDLDKIDREHMLRMLSYQVWPEWHSRASFKVADIENGLLVPLVGNKSALHHHKIIIL